MTCDLCNKKGYLVYQQYEPAIKGVFRYYLCRYHLGWESRKTGIKVKKLRYIPDEQILMTIESEELSTNQTK